MEEFLWLQVRYNPAVVDAQTISQRIIDIEGVYDVAEEEPL